MTLGRKLTYAKLAIESALRHESDPLAARREAAAILHTHIGAELADAESREAAHVKKALCDAAEVEVASSE